MFTVALTLNTSEDTIQTWTQILNVHCDLDLKTVSIWSVFFSSETLSVTDKKLHKAPGILTLKKRKSFTK